MNKNLITHLVCGYPSLEYSDEILKTLIKYSKFVEVQIPFSDPIADGELISNANYTAIQNGVTTEDCFNFLENNKEFSSNMIVMTYFNIIFRYGVENFLKRLKDIGIFGIIVPDLPFDTIEGEELYNLSKKYGINLIYVVSPNCKNERLKKILSLGSFLVYAISQNITTGNNSSFGEDFKEYIAKLRSFTNLEIGVGFGIKNKEDVEKVLEVADYAIIGSEVIKIYNEKGLLGIREYFENIF